jgi:hypothetical protein
MKIETQIQSYIESQSESKKADLQTLNDLILKINPNAKLWFLDGKDENGKVVSNPNIGYGFLTINYADGKTRDFYQVGLSANTTGISVYIMGLNDKNILLNSFGNRLGKAKITGYCIKFKALKDIDLNVLEEAIRLGFVNE